MSDKRQEAGERAADGPTDDGRVHPRHDCEIQGVCRPVSSWGVAESRWEATITNLSIAGVRLRLGRRFEPGIGLAIELPGEKDGSPNVVFARVLYARATGDGHWDLGCRFVGELSDDELLRLIEGPAPAVSLQDTLTPPPAPPSRLAAPARSIPGTPSDHRSSPRHQSTRCNTVSLAIRPTFGGRPALLVDVSASGMSVMLDRPLESGDVLAIQLCGLEGAGERRIATVRHSHPCPAPPDAPWLPPTPLLKRACRWLLGEGGRPGGTAWIIGCRFTRPLAEDELRELLEVIQPPRPGEGHEG